MVDPAIEGSVKALSAANFSQGTMLFSKSGEKRPLDMGIEQSKWIEGTREQDHLYTPAEK